MKNWSSSTPKLFSLALALWFYTPTHQDLPLAVFIPASGAADNTLLSSKIHCLNFQPCHSMPYD